MQFQNTPKRPTALQPKSGTNRSKKVDNSIILISFVAVVFSLFAIITTFNKTDKTTIIQVAPATTLASTTTLAPASNTPSKSDSIALSPTISEEQAVIETVKKVIESSVTVEVGDSIGSGFLYDDSGLLITAAHVVTDDEGEVSQTAIIGITNGSNISERVQGKIIGADKKRDIAVIQIDSSLDFKIVPLALNSAPVQLGQTLLAIGNPFGLENTVTKGIVSALNRTVTNNSGEVLGFNLIQTDAPINPGNSGGALINLDGEIVGVNILIETGSDSSNGNVGIGFAVPIKQAYDTATRLVNGESQTGLAYLGITGRSAAFGKLGAFVVDVVAGEAAYLAGIQKEDLIIKADGMNINEFNDLLSVVQLHEPGDSIELTIIRTTDGVEEELMLSLVLGTATPS